MQQITEIQSTIVEQLQASKVHGFPFFAYTGIKSIMRNGENEIILRTPSNPNKVYSISIEYNVGSDLYDVTFYHNRKGLHEEKKSGIFFDMLAKLITREMGVF